MDRISPPLPRDHLLRPRLSPLLGAAAFGTLGGTWLTVSGLLEPAVAQGSLFGGWGLLGAASAVVYGLLRATVRRAGFSPCLDDLPEAVFLLDARAIVLRWNARAEDLTRGALDWTGKPFIEAAIADDQSALSQVIATALEDGGASFIARIRTNDGTSLPCQGEVVRISPSRGRKGGILVSMRDVSAEAAARQRHAEREGSLLRMVEMAPHLMLIVLDGRVVWANQASLRLLGADHAGQLLNRPWSDFHRPAEHDNGDRLIALDGREFPVELSSQPTLHDDRPARIFEARDLSPLLDASASFDEAERRLRGVMEMMPESVLITDDKGIVLAMNPAVERVFGHSPRDLIGKDVAVLIPAETLDRHLAGIYHPAPPTERRALRTLESLAVRRDGSILPVSVTRNEIRVNGRRQFTAVIRDQTERKVMHSRLAIAEKVLESTSEGVMVSDAKARILWVNGGFTRISGYTREEVIGNSASLMKSGIQPPAFYEAMWHDINTLGEWSGEIWNRRKDGEAFPEWLTIKAVRDEAGEIDRYVGVFSDISRHKRAEETIRHLTYYDPVTRLPNRYLFQDRIIQALERSRRNERQVALALVSLDRFKTVNETLGHQVGDALLREVAQRLGNAVRADDTVSRLRGDTFCCVLTELLHIHDTNPVINRILESFTLPFILAEHELFITASIGISLFPLDGTEVDDLLQKAETAMNRSKERADNTYHFYTPEMNANSMERLRLETDLRKAINRNELLLYYQPKVETTTGRLVGSEALIRWRHPEFGMVPPARFIPIAEDTGLILPIGSYVLQTACDQLQSWINQGLTPVKVAVNLSAHQFRQPNLVELIQDVLANTGVPPHLIELELTESSVMRNADAAVQTLRKLHELGLSIAIDDFGTGYSSLSYLKKFPIDRLKVDRSFVQDLGQNQAGEEIVGAIIAMAHSLKMSVVAEGVETNQQHGMLNDLACDEIQGYFYSRPLPAEDFAKLLGGGVLIGSEDTAP